MFAVAGVEDTRVFSMSRPVRQPTEVAAHNVPNPKAGTASIFKGPPSEKQSPSATNSRNTINVKGSQKHQTLQSEQETNRVVESAEGALPATSETLHSLPQMSRNEFRKLFNSAYSEFYNHNNLSNLTKEKISAQDVDVEEFLQLTAKKQNARYISLLDGRILFHEVPNAPHGQIIGYLNRAIDAQIDHTILQQCTDNDLFLTNRCHKRPDSSFGIRKPQIPNPRPPWLKLLPNDKYGMPYPNIVVEVAVNNESPAVLQDFAQKYFSRNTSVRLWIAVKIWLGGKRYWVGWGERRPAGSGCRIHTSMGWPPNAERVTAATNLVYHIPMPLVYGPGIPVPANAPNSLHINVDGIRQEIAAVIL